MKTGWRLYYFGVVFLGMGLFFTASLYSANRLDIAFSLIAGVYLLLSLFAFSVADTLNAQAKRIAELERRASGRPDSIAQGTGSDQ
jgi:hypothetical protein